MTDTRNNIANIIAACSIAISIDGSTHSALRVKTLADFLAKSIHGEVTDTLLAAVQDLVQLKDQGRRLVFTAPIEERQKQLES